MILGSYLSGKNRRQRQTLRSFHIPLLFVTLDLCRLPMPLEMLFASEKTSNPISKTQARTIATIKMPGLAAKSGSSHSTAVWSLQIFDRIGFCIYRLCIYQSRMSVYTFSHVTGACWLETSSGCSSMFLADRSVTPWVRQAICDKPVLLWRFLQNLLCQCDFRSQNISLQAFVSGAIMADWSFLNLNFRRIDNWFPATATGKLMFTGTIMTGQIGFHQKNC